MARRLREMRIAAAWFVLVAGGLAQNATPPLEGLWWAERDLPARVEGRLLLLPEKSGFVADVGGFRVPVTRLGERLSFVLPEGLGEFRGRVAAGGQQVHGFWLQPVVPGPGRRFATNVTLRRSVRGGWEGKLDPLATSATFFLPITSTEGLDRTYLRGLEQNLGIFNNVQRLVRDGDTVRLLGLRRRESKETIIAEGAFRDGRLVFPSFIDGNSYAFERVADPATSTFYPRGKPAPRYGYTAPVQLDDGWAVGTLDDAGISRNQIEEFVQMLLEAPMETVHTPQIHGVLIARHGKLVLEEYFHGYHRERVHDTRSASKSWTSILIGAAMQADLPLRLDTPVYSTMLGELPSDLDPRKRAMRLEHLLSMTAGYDCAEGNPNAPGNEDRMQSQTAEPDWYRYMLQVPLASAPGEALLYCSGEPNLAAGMLEKVAREPLPELFDRLVARPLEMQTYHLSLTPTGTAYGGGGHHFRPRDFMKLAQLMMNGGQWKGVSIVSRQWARDSVRPLRRISNEPPAGQDYGWLWNSKEYPYRDGKVRGFFAAGNGGQIFMAIPELDLVIAFVGGNYGDPDATRYAQRTLIPQYILPAVREPGDDKHAPVSEQEYTNPYGRSDDGSRIPPRK
jgi:CubicO group peptidase (beta-lactamase class C family)